MLRLRLRLSMEICTLYTGEDENITLSRIFRAPELEVHITILPEASTVHSTFLTLCWGRS